MTSYRAQVRVEDGMLHTSRPLTAPDPVADMIDGVSYPLRDGDSPIVSVEVVIETSTDSETPIGDSVSATSSTPIGDSVDASVGDAEPAQVTTPPVPGGQPA